MSQRFMLGIFDNEEDILQATQAARARGLKVHDVFAPYAVHGLQEAMGLEPSRLPWVCFLLGLVGAAFKVWFEFWTTAVSWPVNVGGKPWNSLPAFVPVTFEVMVLFAGVSTVVAFLVARRLYPGKTARLPIPEVTNDRFVLMLEETDATFDTGAVESFLRSFRAVHVEERVTGNERR